MKEYHVYILRCADNSLYTGVSNNYKLRFEQHQQGIHPTSYTFRRRPVTLVYAALFHDIRDAIAREKQIKKWSKQKKETLIEGKWEKLPDLSKNGYAKRIDTVIVMVRRAHHDNMPTCLPELIE